MASSLQVLGVFLLSLCATSSSFDALHNFDPRIDPMAAAAMGQGPFVPHDYVRFADVKRQCQSLLSSARELAFDANRANALRPELSFIKGDWAQDVDHAPLMPFDGTDVPKDASSVPDPIRLATFGLMHVDGASRGHTVLNVSGILGIAISRNGTSPEMGPAYVSPEFKIWPGSTELKILFEGVYVDTSSGKDGAGERVLCMVGNAMLPTRGNDAASPWAWANNSDKPSFQPPTASDDKIVLVLRYPKDFALTTRAVRGELTSTNAKSSIAYFDKVRLVSQMGSYANYKFGAEKLVSTACSPYPYRDDIVSGGMELYKGGSFCGILDSFAAEDAIAVVPNWNCNSTDAFCTRLGPFKTDRAIDASDGGFAGIGILLQDVRCQPRSPPNGEHSARVSAVFRLAAPWEHRYTTGKRSGLSGMTLSAEGVWKASTGQLCMVGCLGVGDRGCRSRICLYIPTTFSITHRSIMLGRITSIDGTGGTSSHFPLSFERATRPSELWGRFNGPRTLVTAYKYAKTEQARAFLQRSEPFDFGAVVAKSVLSYPKKKAGDGDDAMSLANLAEDLTFHIPVVTELFQRGRSNRAFLFFEVLSVGPLVGRPSPAFHNASFPTMPVPAREAGSLQPLNVSAELTLSGTPYSNVSALSVEGVYNPVDGRMYLMGCRKVQASWKVLSERKGELEEGMDCMVEVKLEYPPTTARWLINPTVKVSIASGRSAADPLHFNATALETLPILYRTQRQDILSRRSVEGILRVVTLSAAIACELNQLLYIKAHADVMPYVSLVMLGVQALGYSVPLITGAEALLDRMTAAGAGAPPSYEVDKSQLYWTIDCLVKVLILAAFLLTLRLGQKVWRSRIRMLTRSPLEPGRVPTDKKVFLVTFGVHFLGFLFVLIVRYIDVLSRPVRPEDTYMDSRGKSHALHEWVIVLEEYVGLVQDFFLLPQIVGNVVWRINCRPLKKSYYVGVTAVRLLPHLYDYVRAPAINPYFSEEFEFVNTSLDFYSKFGDVAIPVTAVVFMAAVYVQQRWNYKIISRTVKTQQKKLQHLGSRVYERLPSMSSPSFEAELVSGVNEGVAGKDTN